MEMNLSTMAPTYSWLAGVAKPDPSRWQRVTREITTALMLRTFDTSCDITSTCCSKGKASNLVRAESSKL